MATYREEIVRAELKTPPAGPPLTQKYQVQVRAVKSQSSESGDEHCTCCPYGYHIDLDFLKYCENMSNGNTLKQLKKIKRNKKKLRKSMEFILDQESGTATENYGELPPDIVHSADASRILNIVEYESSATRNILEEIDSSVNAKIKMAGRQSYVMQSAYDNNDTSETMHAKFGTFSYKNAVQEDASVPSTLGRTDSVSSISSLSTVSSEQNYPTTNTMYEHSSQHTKSTYRTTTVTSSELAATIATHFPQQNGSSPAHNSVTFDSQNSTMISKASLEAIREAMAVSLQRMRELEEQVKTIPVLQVRISVLKEEKRLLMLQLKAQTHKLNQRSVGVSNRTTTSEKTVTTSERSCRTLEEITSRIHVEPPKQIEQIQHKAYPQPQFHTVQTVAVMKTPATRSIGIGDHSVEDPYDIQPDLSSAYFSKYPDTHTETWEKETIILQPIQSEVSHVSHVSQLAQHVSSTSAEHLVSSSPAAVRSPKPVTRTVGVGDGNVYDQSDSGLHIHEKELRTLIIGQPSTSLSKRNVGVECKVSTRDVGISYICDDLKPSMRSVGVGTDDGSLSSTLNIRFKSEEITTAIRQVLSKNVRSVGVSCHLHASGKEVGTQYRWEVSTRSMGCGNYRVDDVPPEPQKQVRTFSVACEAKPTVTHRYCLTEKGLTMEQGTLTDSLNVESRFTNTPRALCVNSSTITDNPKLKVDGCQTDVKIFMALEQICNRSCNTDIPNLQTVGVNTQRPTLTTSNYELDIFSIENIKEKIEHYQTYTEKTISGSGESSFSQSSTTSRSGDLLQYGDGTTIHNRRQGEFQGQSLQSSSSVTSAPSMEYNTIKSSVTYDSSGGQSSGGQSSGGQSSGGQSSGGQSSGGQSSGGQSSDDQSSGRHGGTQGVTVKQRSVKAPDMMSSSSSVKTTTYFQSDALDSDSKTSKSSTLDAERSAFLRDMAESAKMSMMGLTDSKTEGQTVISGVRHKQADGANVTVSSRVGGNQQVSLGPIVDQQYGMSSTGDQRYSSSVTGDQWVSSSVSGDRVSSSTTGDHQFILSSTGDQQISSGSVGNQQTSSRITGDHSVSSSSAGNESVSSSVIGGQLVYSTGGQSVSSRDSGEHLVSSSAIGDSSFNSNVSEIQVVSSNLIKDQAVSSSFKPSAENVVVLHGTEQRGYMGSGANERTVTRSSGSSVSDSEVCFPQEYTISAQTVNIQHVDSSRSKDGKGSREQEVRTISDRGNVDTIEGGVLSGGTHMVSGSMYGRSSGSSSETMLKTLVPSEQDQTRKQTKQLHTATHSSDVYGLGSDYRTGIASSGYITGKVPRDEFSHQSLVTSIRYVSEPVSEVSSTEVLYRTPQSPQSSGSVHGKTITYSSSSEKPSMVTTVHSEGSSSTDQNLSIEPMLTRTKMISKSSESPQSTARVYSEKTTHSSSSGTHRLASEPVVTVTETIYKSPESSQSTSRVYSKNTTHSSSGAPVVTEVVRSGEGYSTNQRLASEPVVSITETIYKSPDSSQSTSRVYSKKMVYSSSSGGPVVTEVLHSGEGDSADQRHFFEPMLSASTAMSKDSASCNNSNVYSKKTVYTHSSGTPIGQREFRDDRNIESHQISGLSTSLSESSHNIEVSNTDSDSVAASLSLSSSSSQKLEDLSSSADFPDSVSSSRICADSVPSSVDSADTRSSSGDCPQSVMSSSDSLKADLDRLGMEMFTNRQSNMLGLDANKMHTEYSQSSGWNPENTTYSFRMTETVTTSSSVGSEPDLSREGGTSFENRHALSYGNLSEPNIQLKSCIKRSSSEPGAKKEISFAESVQGGFELSAEMRNACEILHIYLEDSTRVQTKELNSCLDQIRQEWFKVSSHKLSNPHQVEDYLSSFNEIDKKLLKYIVNLLDSNGNCSIHYSVSHSNFEIVSLLLDTNVCDVDKQNKAGYSAIMLASLAYVQTDAHRDTVKRLFRMGDVNGRSSQAKQTALMLSVSHGRGDMVKLLLECGADINCQDEDGSTALMCACEHGHIEIVKTLITDLQCDASLTDNDGQNALAIAMEAGHKDIGVILYAHLNFSKQPVSPGLYRKRRTSSDSSSSAASTPR
ncbi:GPI-anchored adhesin PGA55 isoform X2 [Octopus vulgaris]|uniref:GPI-anchored adhesin PGA55 isoform X2 n=1 Tax=Octopus vulgaris TaxID=6645 RepID=A0AA36AZW3_OCTVU|nr:GPI-anchored adhesin PGA55 isoform X2 [Octopus vulgaris]